MCRPACDSCTAGDQFVERRRNACTWICCEHVFGLTSLPVSDRLCNSQGTWRSEERCAAVLFGFTRVMSVYAPDSEKDHKDDDNSWRERRKFYWIDDGVEPSVSTLRATSTLSWDCCVQAMKRTRSSLCGMYGPQRWQGYGTDPGGFKKMMWYNIMKEYHCKAMSTWLSCDERKEMSFTHKQWGKNGRRSQQDYILGVEGRLWSYRVNEEGSQLA